MKLNLGCGKKKIDGFVNCDIDKSMNPDKIIDLSKKLPFKDNTIDEVFTSHTLEHIPKNVLVNTTLPEIWRVCKNGAILKIIVPFMDSQNVLNHVTRFNRDTFNNWCKEKYNYSNDSFPFNFSFELIEFEYGVSKIWGWIFRLIPLKLWQGIWEHLVAECRVTMKVRK